MRRGAYVGAVAFEVAVFVAFGDVGAFDDALGAVLHAAVAGYRHFAGSVEARDEFPAGAFAVRAILEGHGDSIRLRGWNGKVLALRKLWTAVGQAFLPVASMQNILLRA